MSFFAQVKGDKNGIDMKIKNFFKIIGHNKRKPDIYLEFFHAS